jgi:hypothetical protein
MGITFLNPLVWWSALLVAVPVAIHLLTRATRRPLRFPTVRFLEATRLSAVSRSAIEDWPLLVIRVLMILAAVAALAGPVVVTPAREAAWRARVARAVVLEDRTAAPDDEVRTAAVATVLARGRLRDAVADGVRWLEQQSPAAKEIVVLSAFRRGSADAVDFAQVPATVGIRLVRTGTGAAVRDRDVTRLVLRDGGLFRVTERLTLSPSSTQVRETGADRLAEPPITVTAEPAEQAVADAGLRAVLRRGILLPPAGLLEPIAVAWPGSADALAGDIDRRLAAPLDAWEPEVVPDQVLASLSRAPGPVDRPTPVDSGDRQVAWALVVGLLIVEQFMRQGNQA